MNNELTPLLRQLKKFRKKCVLGDTIADGLEDAPEGKRYIIDLMEVRAIERTIECVEDIIRTPGFPLPKK